MQRKKSHQCTLWFDIGNGMDSKQPIYYLPDIDKQTRKYALYCFFLKLDNHNTNTRQLHASYEDYLKTEHWRNLKIKIFTKSIKNTGLAKKCYIENCSGNNVQLHHIRYDRLGTDDEEHDIIPLCKAHHWRVHDNVSKQKYPGVCIYTITQDFVNKKNKINKLNVPYNSKYYYDEETATDIY
jgi:hypothetical protein